MCQRNYARTEVFNWIFSPMAARFEYSEKLMEFYSDRYCLKKTPEKINVQNQNQNKLIKPLLKVYVASICNFFFYCIW